MHASTMTRLLQHLTRHLTTLLIGFAVLGMSLGFGPAATPAQAQTDPTNDEPDSSTEPLLVQSVDTPLTFTFDKADFDVDLYNQVFDYGGGEFGGFDPAPTAAQVDGTEFTAQGISGDANEPNFGDSRNSGRYANGNSSGGVTDGGLWGFDVDNSGGTSSTNWALGAQPTAQDLTPGSMYLCYQNKTGTQVEDANVTFDFYQYNDQASSVQVTVSALTTTTYCDASQSTSSATMGGGPFATTGAAASSPQWQSAPAKAYFGNLSLGADSYFMVKITVEAASGGAPFDEIAIDNPSVTFNPSNPVPVELAAFDVVSDGASAELTWRTTSEQNNAGFAVQHRAPEASGWTRIGYRDGAGTTSEAQRYRFETDGLASGRHTFRLKQIDTDGTAHFSDVQTVRIQRRAGMSVGPNPLQGGTQATVRLTVGKSQPVTVAVYNVLGQRVRTLHDGRVTPGEPVRAKLSTDGLPSGIYFVRAEGPSISRTQRVTVVQ